MMNPKPISTPPARLEPFHGHRISWDEMAGAFTAEERIELLLTGRLRPSRARRKRPPAPFWTRCTRCRVPLLEPETAFGRTDTGGNETRRPFCAECFALAFPRERAPLSDLGRAVEPVD